MKNELPGRMKSLDDFVPIKLQAPEFDFNAFKGIIGNVDFEKQVENKKCNHPEHDFPMFLWIPPGGSHTHVCPGCGNEITATSPNITF